jgi:hypothetical protein
MNNYFQTFADEVLSKFERVNKLISHSASIGTYRETLIRHYLSQFLSRRYSVKTGFVYDPQNDQCSKQTDILIIDESHSAPFLFSDGDFVIAKSESVVLGIEIKSNLDKNTFHQAVENCFAFKNVVAPKKCFFIFAFKTSKNIKSLASSWYKDVDPAKDQIGLYPGSIYCMNVGKFGIVPPSYATEWGHYFMVPQNDKTSPESMVMTSFIADIVKNIDLINNDSKSNPYTDYGNVSMTVLHNCLRFGQGELSGKIKI